MMIALMVVMAVMMMVVDGKLFKTVVVEGNRREISLATAELMILARWFVV